ncbi:hypothetical protein [Lactiplantibacillus daowaiensis]|uniref:Uncharacterized protein n=1 Tax=Lactiplantibacillus daowaiensis TaxID=2559918 RepID=A0ABW1S291_9LACO|nr:hypothetical protein [Lactiplantibacillus daowaiensis]
MWRQLKWLCVGLGLLLVLGWTLPTWAATTSRTEVSVGFTAASPASADQITPSIPDGRQAYQRVETPQSTAQADGDQL